MKLFEFMQVYYDSSTIIAKLRENGLLPMSVACQNCSHQMVNLIVNKGDGVMFSCNRATCRKRKSIRAGSFFERAKLPLCDCMLILHLWSKGYTERLIIEEFSLSRPTIVDWFRYCRELCVFYFENSSMVIGGPGNTVEIDETLAIKRKNNQGRILSAGWLFGGIERRNDGQFNCFIRMVYDRSEAHLTHLVRKHVAPGTHIITDGWGAYRNLSNIGYLHSVIIHEENFVSPDNNSVHTQTIEATWSSLKRFVRSRGTNKSEFYLEYVCEYIFRRKFSDVFLALLDVIRQQYVLTN